MLHLRRDLSERHRMSYPWGMASDRLLDQGRLPEAYTAARRAVEADPRSAPAWIALANASNRLMRSEQALAAYRRAEQIDPSLPLLHLSVGHLLKTLGRREECERVYRECLERASETGHAWWSLADLKNFVFKDADIEAMQVLVHSGAGGPSNQARIHFALGRAFEQRGEDRQAFAHYRVGNALRRREQPFDFDAFEDKSRRIIDTFDRSFFDHIQGAGCDDDAPIFIVGLPRSGSTLVEQILASHSAVEGTMELPNVLRYVGELHAGARGSGRYPERIRALTRNALNLLGRRYIQETAPLRSGRLHFIDKMPNNFSHVGLIHAMLPRARIIDVRRNPMDACFSCYKQNFAAGQSFTYDLAGLGRYYRQYLAMMDHWDTVLPGVVLRVEYEALVRSPEANIRLLLDHCGLPFERSCVDFHRTARAVRTASAEQVRQPIYRAGVGHWRRFERELAPLRRALGEAWVDEQPVCASATILPRRRSVLSVAIVSLLYAGWSTRLAAAGAMDVLEPIVVTARKRAENLQDVPLNVDALSSRDLQNLDVAHIEDFSLLTPSISLISTGPGGQRVFIRGASDGSDPNFGHSNLSTTGFLVDDLSFSFFGHVPDYHLYDVERIEVLNGPQGTLFGPGSLSGAVRIITHKPDPHQFAAGVDAEGTRSQGGGPGGTLEGFINFPFRDGRTALRISAYRSHEGGYIENVPASRNWLNGVTSTNAAWAGDEYNVRNLRGERIALQHDFSDAWLVRLTATDQSQVYRGSWEDDPTNVGVQKLRRFSPQGGRNNLRVLELHVEGDVGIGEITYAGGHATQDSDRLYDFSDSIQYTAYPAYVQFAQGLNCATDPFAGPGNHGCKPPIMFGDVAGNLDRWSNELRLQSKPGGKVQWTVGAYWERTRNPYHGFQHMPNINFQGETAQSVLQPGAAPLPEEFYSDFATYRTTQTSEFGDVTIDLGQRWRLEAGIEHFQSKSSDSTEWASYFYYAKTPSFYSASAHKTNFKAGLEFRPEAKSLVYLTFAQGFRDGGFNYVNLNRHPDIPGTFQPDTLDNLELGWKLTRLDGRLIWNTAVYDMEWRNYQVGVKVQGPPFGFNANIGEARIIGVESSVDLQPMDGLQLSFNANYNDGTLRRNSYQNPAFVAPAGTRLPEAPLWNCSAQARYEHAITAGLRAFVQLDAEHKGSMWTDLRIDQRVLQPGYTLSNLRIGAGAPEGGWQVEGFVTNLANKRAVFFINTTGYDTLPGYANPEIAAPPRTYGLRVKFRWHG